LDENNHNIHMFVFNPAIKPRSNYLHLYFTWELKPRFIEVHEWYLMSG